MNGVIIVNTNSGSWNDAELTDKQPLSWAVLIKKDAWVAWEDVKPWCVYVAL